MTSTWLNKIMGCESPRCRRCKCRDGLPLTKVSHWIVSEKADRSSPETQVRRPTGMDVASLHPCDGQRGLLCCAEKRLRQYLVLPQLFCLLGGSVLQQEKSIVLTKAEKQLIEVIRSLDYGEVRVMIKDNKPIRVEEIRRSIQLPNEK